MNQGFSRPYQLATLAAIYTGILVNYFAPGSNKYPGITAFGLFIFISYLIIDYIEEFKNE